MKVDQNICQRNNRDVDYGQEKLGYLSINVSLVKMLYLDLEY